jgi:hypothetical protein
MFRQAVKRGKMDFNPCLGMDKAHEADPNANREWFAAEWQYARENAPLEIKIALMLARYAGLRGQAIVVANRKHFEDHPLTGKCVRFVAGKNKKSIFLPVMQELQDFMAELKVIRSDGLIAVRDDGTPWEGEVEMQTRVSHWLRLAATWPALRSLHLRLSLSCTARRLGHFRNGPLQPVLRRSPRF